MNEEGKLFEYANLDVVDEWSREAYQRFKDWPLARFGTWSTWSGAPYYGANYLLLELEVVSERGRTELASLYTAEEELTFATRGWHEHSDPADDSWAHVKDLAERWFNGEFLIVSYFDGDDWKGTKTIDAGSDLRGELSSGLDWVRQQFNATRVELLGPYKSADRIFAVGASGVEFRD